MSIESMLVGLVRAEVTFVIIGGVAGTVHGSPHVTNDLDVCYETAPGNLDRILGVLREWSAYPRGWEPGLPFELDRRTLQSTPMLTLRTREGDLDLLDRVEGVGEYAAALASSAEIAVFGVTARVLTLPALIAAKRAAGRSRDIEHLKVLEALLDMEGGNRE